MKVDVPNVVLFIEPKLPVGELVNDRYTEGIKELLQKSIELSSKSGKRAPVSGIVHEDGSWSAGMGTRGWHTCVCGETSHACDYMLIPGYYTNSLAVHYLESHRGEVPKTELEKIDIILAKVKQN
jgi:hypothetical protein